MRFTTGFSIYAQLMMLTLSLTAYAGDTPQEIALRIGSGDVNAGKVKSKSCQECHSEEGNLFVPGSAKLAGQYADYIQNQVFGFQEGTRKDPSMTEIAMKMTNRRDLLDIASYFASLNQMSGIPKDDPAGEKLYIENGCLSCHGENGKGKPNYNSIFPIIGGQDKNYLIKQMKEYKSGARNTDVSGFMYMVTEKMSDEDIEVISDYLSNQ